MSKWSEKHMYNWVGWIDHISDAYNKINEWMTHKRVKIGNSICRCFNMHELMQPLDALLNDNPNYLLSENNLLSPMHTMDTFNMMEAIHELFKHERDLVSQGFKDALDYLSKFIPLRYIS